MSPGTAVAVTGLAGLGSVLRFVLEETVSRRLGRGFPFGTLVVNVSGAAVLGVLAGLSLSHHAALLAGTATVGSYTTFSAWMLDSDRLAGRGWRGRAVLNLGGSLVLGVGAAAVGRLVAGG